MQTEDENTEKPCLVNTCVHVDRHRCKLKLDWSGEAEHCKAVTLVNSALSASVLIVVAHFCHLQIQGVSLNQRVSHRPTNFNVHPSAQARDGQNGVV